jgi:glycogen operon protein
MSTQTTRPGSRFPLGASPAADGTNFAVTASAADGVELCLFDAAGVESRIELSDYDAGVWHGFVAGVGPGAHYGYRVHGAYDPSHGLRMNPAKLLLDPYARATTGAVVVGPEILGYDPNNADQASRLDSAAHVPSSIVVAPLPPSTTRPRQPRRLADAVIYEAHVKGLTMTHPAVPAELQGTYAGVAHEAVIGHLVDLGVTTLELLPVHQHVGETFLAQRGLTNYWGYNTIGFFAPQDSYSAAVRAGQPGGQVAEFRAMVDALHEAGLEVILDVVFNHSAEGNHLGPTLCFRGLDNVAYYRLDPNNLALYVDTTGTGNSLNVASSTGLQLIMDSLRYWIVEMGVDGYRFDLAPTLARAEGYFDMGAAFLDMVSQDPVVSRAKLIAEPWDVGQGDSYDIGRFPAQWSEWNGKYRDTMRDFWRRQNGLIGDFATRFSGSSDLYGYARRRPTASINFITVHDGFTLRDLVSYDNKHNEANGEDNRDGTDDNRSSNGGVEGPTDDLAVLAWRGRQQRAFLATLLLSFGVPMLLAGDEMGRTQNGNNNAYCQDNATTWIDWGSADKELLDFTRRLVGLRRAHPVFRRRRFLSGASVADLAWYTPAGAPMDSGDWADPNARSVAIRLEGQDSPDRAADGSLLVDDDFLVLVNGWWEPLEFTLPLVGPPQRWVTELDTAGDDDRAEVSSGAVVTVGPQAITVLRSPRLV